MDPKDVEAFSAGLSQTIASLKEYWEVQQAAQNDVTYSRDQHAVAPASQFWRRSYIRCLFSYIDAVVNATCAWALYLNAKMTLANHTHMLLGSDAVYEEVLSEPEVAFLNGRQPHLKDNGRVSTRPLRVGTEGRLLYAMRALSQVTQAGVVPDTEKDPNWERFKEAISIRDNITHPKTIDSYDVTDEQMEVVSLGTDWFIEAILPIQEAAVKRVEEMEARDRQYHTAYVQMRRLREKLESQLDPTDAT